MVIVRIWNHVVYLVLGKIRKKRVLGGEKGRKELARFRTSTNGTP